MRVKKIAQYWRTLKHLKLIQITNRVSRQLISPSPVKLREIALETLANPWVQPIPKPASIRPGDRFYFLNQEEAINRPTSWNSCQYPKLWLYNLHYHDGLGADSIDQKQKVRLISRWIHENPFGSGNGWEPYPLSLRIVNWVKWLIVNNCTSQGINESLFQQSHMLSKTLEYHLLGNHLFANAKALIFSGLYFKGERPQLWYNMGLRILQDELEEQFLPDGAHFELSTIYHSILIEDLLDLVNIMRAYGKEVPSSLLDTVKRALTWLDVMTRPDGKPPLFNDAAYGIAATLDQLTEYAKNLNVPWHQRPTSSLTDMPESGYFRYDGTHYSFWGDAGPIGPDYIPGHAHCDMFNFELFAHGRPVVVDTGTSTYEAGERRFLERSTLAHNTVQVDQLEQSEIWGAFRLGRRARILSRTVAEDKIIASHDGFKGIGLVHKRTFEFSTNKIRLIDTLSGKKSGVAIARFHLHPGVNIAVSSYRVQAGSIEFHFSGAKNIAIAKYEYAPQFNKRLPSLCIEVTFHQNLWTDILI